MTTPLLLNVGEQAVVENVKDDIRLSFSDGMAIDTNGDGTGDVPYGTDLPLPIPNYNALVPPGSTTDKKAADGNRALMSAVVRRLGPVGYQYCLRKTVGTQNYACHS